MSHKLKRHEQICLMLITVLAGLVAVSCKGQDFGVLQPTPKDLCKCLPTEPDIADYRHLAKHVPIPNIGAQEVSVGTILGWPQDPIMPPDAPRTGRELEVFHIANAFLQNASVNAAMRPIFPWSMVATTAEFGQETEPRDWIPRRRIGSPRRYSRGQTLQPQSTWAL